MADPTQFERFRQSLANHPGLMVGIVFPLIVLASMLENMSFDLVAFVGLSLLPWTLILGSAWMLRNQESEVGNG